MRKSFKKYCYKEYVVCANYSQKFYHKYIEHSKLEHLLHLLFHTAILGTLVMLILEFIIEMPKILYILHLLSLPFFIVFAVHLIAEYAKSDSTKDFFKYHGVDFILIFFLSFYYIFAGISFLSRISFVKELKDFAYEFKNFKIVLEWIKR